MPRNRVRLRLLRVCVQRSLVPTNIQYLANTENWKSLNLLLFDVHLVLVCTCLFLEFIYFKGEQKSLSSIYSLMLSG